MRWSHNKPMMPGFWWMRINKWIDPTVVRPRIGGYDERELGIEIAGSWYPIPEGRQWAVPIPEPEEEIVT